MPRALFTFVTLIGYLRATAKSCSYFAGPPPSARYWRAQTASPAQAAFSSPLRIHLAAKAKQGHGMFFKVLEFHLFGEGTEDLAHADLHDLTMSGSQQGGVL